MKKAFKVDNIETIIIAGILVGVILPFIMVKSTPSWLSFMALGTDGEEIGGIVGGITGTVFSGIAICLLYITYKSQNKELVATRNIAERQSETLIKQQFESTFYKMIELNRQILNSVEISFNVKEPHHIPSLGEVRSEIKQGKNVIKKIIEDINRKIEDIDYEINANKKKTDSYERLKRGINKVWNGEFEKHTEALGHYFRNTYHIVKFVDTYEGFEQLFESSKYKDDEIVKLKRSYLNIFRSMFSNSEMMLLWFNSLGEKGHKFRPYLHNYLLLQNIDLGGHFPAKRFLMDTHPYLRKEYQEIYAHETKSLVRLDIDTFKQYFEKYTCNGDINSPLPVRSGRAIWFLPMVYREPFINEQQIEEIRQITRNWRKPKFTPTVAL